MVLDEVASCGTDVFWTRPLYYAVARCSCGAGGIVHFRQVGVTALGSDSTMDLYAGFTSIPVEAGWIAQSTKALRLG
ncbi:MAG: hypothetical protein ABW279_06710 [Acidimicrobiales bacterium]